MNSPGSRNVIGRRKVEGLGSNRCWGGREREREVGGWKDGWDGSRKEGRAGGF